MAGRMPATPNARSLRSHPSTTPAGPPPSWLTDKSTTPAGPPPSASTFGSSFNPSNNTFARKGFAVPEEDEDDGEEDDGLEDDEDIEMPTAAQTSAFFSSLAASGPRGLKRSRDGKVRENSGLAAIARGMTSRSKPAGLVEADDIIAQGEAVLSELDMKVQQQPAQSEFILAEASSQLTKLWSRHSDPATKQGSIGPASKDAFSKANYLASLLLALHNPHAEKPKVDTSRSRRPSNAGARPHYSVPVPQALLAWLNAYHKPFSDDYEDIHLNSPSPSAHDAFWDAIYGNALRGRLERVARLLADAGWENAVTAPEDGSEAGYSDAQVENAEEVAARCVRLLKSCPGPSNGDWDVKGMEWTLFRQRTRQALEDLEDFAEGMDMRQSQVSTNMFSRSTAGGSLGISGMSRRAESKVPWSIYENLKMLYGLLLGSLDEVMMASQDWLEAALYLTIWWDGEDDTPMDASISRASLRKGITREIDIAPLAAYRQRLTDAFLRVTEDPEDPVFQPNTMDLLQLGLACVIEDSVGSVLGILRTWSMPVTIAVMEIAALGNWLPSVRPRSRRNLLDQGFSKEDLLVLSHGPAEANPEAVDRDELLSEYAEEVAEKRTVQDKEGWELAVALLKRLDDATNAKERIRLVMDKLDLSDDARINKVLGVCDQLGLIEHRKNLADRYADNVAENTESYGTALIYYARARDVAKLKATLALLTSLCLLHSAAMPTSKLIDAQLQSLISHDRTALRTLASTDPEAATLLASHLSGYAILRRFYDLRDQNIYIQQNNGSHVGKAPPLRSLERRREAASKLFTVIKSASDCIPGGLFDPETESVVPVDGLLALFGEALPFLGQGTRIFTQQQVFGLLKLVEEFSNAPSRIRENADSLLAASLRAYQDGSTTASGILKKSRSDLSQSSWDLMVTSSMLAQSQVKGAKIERGWDWRQGVNGIGGMAVKADDIVRVLREALVREVAQGWGGQLNW